MPGGAAGDAASGGGRKIGLCDMSEAGAQAIGSRRRRQQSRDCRGPSPRPHGSAPISTGSNARSSSFGMMALGKSEASLARGTDRPPSRKRPGRIRETTSRVTFATASLSRRTVCCEALEVGSAVAMKRPLLSRSTKARCQRPCADSVFELSASDDCELDPHSGATHFRRAEPSYPGPPKMGSGHSSIRSELAPAAPAAGRSGLVRRQPGHRAIHCSRYIHCHSLPISIH